MSSPFLPYQFFDIARLTMELVNRNLRVVYKTEMADVYEKRKREAKARKEEKERLAALTDTEGVVAELDP